MEIKNRNTNKMDNQEKHAQIPKNLYSSIQPVHSKGDQSWVFFGRNYAKAETPALWPPHAKS